MQEVKSISSYFGPVSNRGFELLFHVNFYSTKYPISRTELLTIVSIGTLTVSITLNVYVHAHSETGILYKSKETAHFCGTKYKQLPPHFSMFLL